jgi:2,5-diketo-D-gluconate reductase A
MVTVEVMSLTTSPRQLNDGTTIPAIGFGTYQLNGAEGVEAVVSALEVGYRLLDTAVNYGNEQEVGEAIRRSGVDRDEIVVTSKVPGRHHAYDDAVRSTEESLERLGLDRIDLHLIHWPNPSDDLYPETWRALVDLQKAGKVRSIGVSNFKQHHLARVVEATGVVPAVNQVELHPYFPQDEQRAVDADLGIVTEAWSPIGKDVSAFGEAPVVAAAERYGVTPAQVVLRWHLQLGSVPIPKSATPSRQRENLDLDGFALTDDEVAAIAGLAKSDGRRFGGDPDTHEEQ